jgi:putative tryptophan/tyrosine transport system substrate-binding protein
MKRREFIKALGGAATIWPVAASADASGPVVAFVSGRSRSGDDPYLPAMQQAFAENGFVDGKTMTFTARWAEGQYGRVPELTKELIAQGANVIITIGTAVDRAAMETTSKIPIVFVTADDPVAVGLVASLNRPTGNVTGVTMMSSELRPKMVELLHELVPQATTFFMLANPNNSSITQQIEETKVAAGKIGIAIDLLTASTPAEIDTAFGVTHERQGKALLMASDPFFTDRHGQITALAARYALPAIYPWREYTASGGLISYGSSIQDAYRQAATYVIRILKGASPADLPVVQPTKFELVINLKTAKALGLSIPEALLATADEVIE